MDSTPPPDVIKQLKAFFHRNGYVRRLDAVRRVEDGHLYKKGAEVRLTADSKTELADIRRLLKQAGFKRVRPFEKANQWRQPIYGVAEVARFIKLVGMPRKKKKVAKKSARK